ncbi:MAG: 3-oxoacyl-[acyl-carrier-protein] reductase [Bacteroidales bacterium]|nr:3-oxoacyl-[acyl-carrier-protein] reductase [Bacteroidales bacterium]
MNLLDNKVALITGAARGIGRTIAIEFAKHGADIAFTDIKADENSESLVNEIAGMGRKVSFYVSNAASFADATQLIENVVADFGRIDVLVNNAGITRDGLLLRMKEEDWDAVINVNLKSVFNLTKSVQSVMLKQRCGSIINISSIVGLHGNVGQANYSASKAGIIGFSKTVAQELGSRSIRCNAIAPGFIASEMTDKVPEEIRKSWMTRIALRKMGTPTDVANVAVFLASDLSSYITGQVIVCDGGMN